MRPKRTRLEILKNKIKGKYLIDRYEKLFSIFHKPIYINLENALNIFEGTSYYFSKIEDEIINGNSTLFSNSHLLIEEYSSLTDSSECYAYTDYYEYCGIFIIKSKEAIEQALYIAKIDEGNTFFILDKYFRYHYRINYYDQDHPDFPDTFDIQRSSA